MIGRIGSDKGVGDFTRMGIGESSVVDYIIASPAMLDMLRDFQICAKLPESDHLPIMFSINCNYEWTYKSGSNVNWAPHVKYMWNANDLPNIQHALCDEISVPFHEQIQQALSDGVSTDHVANAVNALVGQACERACTTKSNAFVKHKYKGPGWYDKECRLKRSQAVKAGERVVTDEQRIELENRCREYRSCKQRKKRNFKESCIEKIEQIFMHNKSDMWGNFNNICQAQFSSDEPTASEFYDHFSKMAQAPNELFFNKEFYRHVKDFLRRYDNGELDNSYDNDLELEILNSNFTVEDVEAAIDCLKNNKSPGCDCIPAEFVKYCKTLISEDFTTVFNYIIESRDLSEVWAEGLRSGIYKAGPRKLVGNYRGITVLSIFAKLFEILVYNRLTYLNEAFDKVDQFNGGFLRGSRTAGNMFILNGLIQRQLAISKPLYVCFVDFSKAFDLVNRYILFYKLIKSGWSGRVIDTVRNFYSKTYFRVKHKGLVSPPIPNYIGVNQGGNASGLMFRKYLADLREYLSNAVGVCIGDVVIAHLLWTDDLILFFRFRERIADAIGWFV